MILVCSSGFVSCVMISIFLSETFRLWAFNQTNLRYTSTNEYSKKIRTLQKEKHTFGSLVTQKGRREKSALTGIFCFLLAADEEHQQNVAAAAAGARPRPHGEERAEGMPRRRRNMGNRLMAQRRAQQAEEWLEGNTGFSWSCRHWNKPSQQVLELGKECSCLLEEVVEFCWGVIWP